MTTGRINQIAFVRRLSVQCATRATAAADQCLVRAGRQAGKTLLLLQLSSVRAARAAECFGGRASAP